RQVRGEVKVKKKLSVGFVLVIALVLAAVTALAAVLLWEQQVIPMKEIEQSEGDYVDWPISQKQVLIRALIDSGNTVESDETLRLFDDATTEFEKHSIADQLVLTLTGQTDVKEITVSIITYAIMGLTDTWTPEQRVWWQQVTEKFHGDGGVPDTLVAPDGTEPTEAEAIAIAKAAILEAYGLPTDALDTAAPVANLYVTDMRPNYRRWDVQFKFIMAGSTNWVERVYCAIVDEAGKVIADPDVGIPSVTEMATIAENSQYTENPPLVQEFLEYAEIAGVPTLRWWPLDVRAAYSQNMRSKVLAVIENGDLSPLMRGTTPEMEMIASSHYVYGLPSETAISQEKALGNARKAITENYGISSKEVEDYEEVLIYFDITKENQPLWRFIFIPQKRYSKMIYRIEVAAKTGEIVTMDEFTFQPLRQYIDELPYHLKLY
ncbi:MAG: hypothetical protein RR224_12550, partial [Clostridia bacterium]